MGSMPHWGFGGYLRTSYQVLLQPSLFSDHQENWNMGQQALSLLSDPPNLMGASVYLPCSPLQGSAPASSFPPFFPSAHYSGTRNLLFSLLLLGFLKPDVFDTQKPKRQLLRSSVVLFQKMHRKSALWDYCRNSPCGFDPSDDTASSQLSLCWLEPHLLCPV